MNILNSPPSSSSSSCSSSSSSSSPPCCPPFPPICCPKPPSKTTTGVRFLSVSSSSLRVRLLQRRRITTSSTWVSRKVSNFGLLVAKGASVEEELSPASIVCDAAAYVASMGLDFPTPSEECVAGNDSCGNLDSACCGGMDGRTLGLADASVISPELAESDVLKALSQIIDPDFGMDIVSCGFVKDLVIDEAKGQVSFRLELTTPACPIKDEFERKANEVVAMLPWVKDVKVTMSAQPARPVFIENLPPGLQTISSIVAVSSCKGGVGKSTVAVNLAYTLAGMGARVGIFDADVYGPSLPTMVSPESRLLEMNPEKRSIIPTKYLGVKLVSFGFTGQGRAIMRGPMVSGVINQLLTTTEWGELDYLIIDMPPGTGDIQLTLCQVVPLTAAVIVTTPQKLAFIDVAKGVRMFSKLKVPCVAVVENMCHFDADGKRYYPFGRGSGAQVVQQFGIPHLFDLPIRPTLSASGDSGMPEVVADPQGEVSRTFQELGVCVVQQCSKIRQQVSTAVAYDKKMKVIRVKVPDSDEEFYLHPATVRRNDRSAQSVDEWTGEQKLQYSDVPENIEPEEIRPMGNYAVSIVWPDGFSQIAPYDQLQTMERLVGVPN